MADTEPSNVDQLRAGIDAGRTGDKIPFPDPAAAPLGTDAEAGGHPPTRQEVRLAARSQAGAPKVSSWPDDRVGIVTYCTTSGIIAALLLLVVLIA